MQFNFRSGRKCYLSGEIIAGKAFSQDETIVLALVGLEKAFDRVRYSEIW